MAIIVLKFPEDDGWWLEFEKFALAYPAVGLGRLTSSWLRRHVAAQIEIIEHFPKHAFGIVDLHLLCVRVKQERITNTIRAHSSISFEESGFHIAKMSNSALGGVVAI
jgi:hypothetical protein